MNNNIREQIIYEIINSNLDHLIQDDIIDSYDNIKEFSTILYLFLEYEYNCLNELVSIDEASLINYMSAYFTDRQNSQLSKLFNFGLIGTDFGAKFALTGQFGSGTAALLTNLGISTSIASIGAATTPFVLLISAFAISKYLNESEIRTTNSLIKISSKLEGILKVKFNKVDKFNSIIKLNCDFKNKKDKTKCASKIFILEYNKNIMNPIIVGYISYLKSNRINISNIHSYDGLMLLKNINNSNLKKLIKQLYITYSKTIKAFAKHDPSLISISYSYLNSIVKKNL